MMLTVKLGGPTNKPFFTTNPPTGTLAGSLRLFAITTTVRLKGTPFGCRDETLVSIAESCHGASLTEFSERGQDMGRQFK